MADDDTPRSGEALTVNYGWVKPTVGDSDDAWGGYINSDLDGIDSIVHGVQTSVPAASSSSPLMDGTAAVGAGTTWARADHIHPTDTSRAAVTALPAASTVAPLPDGNAAVGTSAAYARADHVHPVVYMGDNRIINGDMRIDQRNNGASGTAAGYTVDRWVYYSSQPNKLTWGRGTANFGGFGYLFGFTTTTAFTSAAADTFSFVQLVEADMVSDFQWGTAGARPVTLSFLFVSNQTGIFSGSLSNAAGTRSYPFSFSAPANTGTQVVVTIPGDTAGTWVMSGNTASVLVRFDLGSGTNWRGPANAWASANYMGVTGTLNVVSVNAATFAVTGVKLEIGSVATPFNRQSLAKSQADCERYFRWLPFNMQFYAPTTNATLGTSVTFSSAMRASPTLSLIAPDPNLSASFANNGANVIDQATSYGARMYLTAGGAVGNAYIIGYRASASAEL